MPPLHLQHLDVVKDDSLIAGFEALQLAASAGVHGNQPNGASQPNSQRGNPCRACNDQPRLHKHHLRFDVDIGTKQPPPCSSQAFLQTDFSSSSYPVTAPANSVYRQPPAMIRGLHQRPYVVLQPVRFLADSNHV